MEIQKTSNSQSNLEKEEWNWKNQPAWLQSTLQSYSHQDSMLLAQRQKYRLMEQNRKPRDESMYLWSSLTKEAKIYNREKTISSNKWCWENWSTTCKRMKLEHFLTPYAKMNSKWIKELNVRPETIKLLAENIGRTLNDINQCKILYDPTSREMEIKTKLNNWDLIKLKSFAQQRKL